MQHAERAESREQKEEQREEQRAESREEQRAERTESGVRHKNRHHAPNSNVCEDCEDWEDWLLVPERTRKHNTQAQVDQRPLVFHLSSDFVLSPHLRTAREELLFMLCVLLVQTAAPLRQGFC